MKRLVLFLFALSLAGGAFSQVMTPLLKDPEINNFRGDWSLFGNVYLNQYGWCSDPYYAKFLGGYGTLRQAVTAGGQPKFQFTYSVSVVNPDPSATWASLEINIYDANTFAPLAHVDSVPVSVPRACTTRTVDLGQHNDWRFRNLLVSFEGYTGGAIEIRLENAQLYEYSDPLP